MPITGRRSVPRSAATGAPPRRGRAPVARSGSGAAATIRRTRTCRPPRPARAGRSRVVGREELAAPPEDDHPEHDEAAEAEHEPGLAALPGAVGLDPQAHRRPLADRRRQLAQQLAGPPRPRHRQQDHRRHQIARRVVDLGGELADGPIGGLAGQPGRQPGDLGAQRGGAGRTVASIVPRMPCRPTTGRAAARTTPPTPRCAPARRRGWRRGPPTPGPPPSPRRRRRARQPPSRWRPGRSRQPPRRPTPAAAGPTIGATVWTRSAGGAVHAEAATNTPSAASPPSSPTAKVIEPLPPIGAVRRRVVGTGTHPRCASPSRRGRGAHDGRSTVRGAGRAGRRGRATTARSSPPGRPPAR